MAIASVGRHTLRAYRTGFRYTSICPDQSLCGALSFFYGWNQKSCPDASRDPKKERQRDETTLVKLEELNRIGWLSETRMSSSCLI